MNSLTIGKRIILGFSLIIGILAIIGGYATYQMNSAATGAGYLSNDYIPELAISDNMQDALGNMRANGRSYQYTGDPAFLEKTRAALTEVKTAVKDFETLAAKSTKLVKLKESITKAPQLVTDYEQCLNETEKADIARDTALNTAAKVATDATQKLDTLIVSQSAKMKKAIADKAPETEINERLEKVIQTNTLVDMLNALRIAVLRAQNTRDTKAQEEAISKFQARTAIIDAIKPTFRSAEDSQRLAEVEKLLSVYEQEARALVSLTITSKEVGVKRGAAAHALDTFGDDLSESAQKSAATIAQESTGSLNVASSMTLWGVLIALVIGIGAAWTIIPGIVLPLKNCVEITGFLAKGDFSKEVPENFRNREDEIGELARAFATMILNMRKLIGEVGAGVQTLAAAATELSAASTQIAATAEETSQQTASASAATEQSTASVSVISSAANEMSSSAQSVAAAIEEMSASIHEVSINCQKELEIATEAATHAQSGKEIMGQLGTSAHTIGKVVEIINRIAGQTNLLALNATIEAASAGEAGKGFAVVASEVKELARQTATATNDIAMQVQEMQKNSDAAVKAIDIVANVIEEVNSLSHTIASAVEEQSATVNEIAKNVSHVNTGAQSVATNVSESAKGLTEIANTISGVNTGVIDTSHGIAQVQMSAEELSKLSNGLKILIEQFKI